jgi:hypothetical protein
MSRFADLLTSFVSRAGDVLFVQNPKGTSIGAFCGISLEGLLKIFSPTLGRLKEWVSLEGVHTFYFVAAGVAIFNLPTIFRKRQLPNSVEDAFEVIRRMKREGASTLQIKMQTLSLCNSVIEQIKVDFEKPDRNAKASRYLRERL